jgi:hypothetical protein
LTGILIEARELDKNKLLLHASASYIDTVTPNYDLTRLKQLLLRVRNRNVTNSPICEFGKLRTIIQAFGQPGAML